jgi:ATP phosphoribosyltransferase
MSASGPLDPIRLALPSKGHLSGGAIELLRRAGYSVQRASDRQYEATVAGQPRFHIVFMRPTDIVTQVEEGRCHLGVTGMDVYAERAPEAENARVVVGNLGYGGCRLVMAVPESWIDVAHVIDLVDLTTEFKAGGKTFRISTKYPSLTQAYLRKWGIYYYQLIDSEGALELHPTLGIADVIVDLTSSGTTLKDNRLREIEGGTVLESAACLIGHAPSLGSLVEEGEDGPLALLLDAIDGARAADGWLHLEVVGSRGARKDSPAEWVTSYLRNQGARHLAHGTVSDEHDEPGWRVTGLIKAESLAACQRTLFRKGANRVVGLPARFVYDRDARFTFNSLRAQLGMGVP